MKMQDVCHEVVVEVVAGVVETWRANEYLGEKARGINLGSKFMT